MLRCAFLFILLVTAAVEGADRKLLTGKCVRVQDGDNIIFVDEGKLEHDVRLGAIDAPEGTQPFSEQSRAHLVKLVLNKTVTLEQFDVDAYGRLVGRIFVDGKNINIAMVSDGYAWRYVEFDKAGEYTAAEKEARAKKRGLWGTPNPIPPWEYVKRAREKAKAASEGAKQ